ncbi:hypothetical protein DFH07DRAFT_968765 [Mycena maculata]|uniref:Uncharacterized protein n=1 Tax=Mycena maculata TaxID=230809 RepID=A0AAD7MT21_9AGAR|nr:hypothetical protein DFH07DRAFT_968765 [Mycena maculata]
MRKPLLQPPTLAPVPPAPLRAPLTQSLTRSRKWLARSASALLIAGLAASGDVPPRVSTFSVTNVARKPKILRPTDQGPIDSFGCKGRHGCSVGSRVF